jgi:hypothetical protein
MEPEGSLPRSQEPSIGPYSERDRFNPLLRQTNCLIRIQWVWGVKQKKLEDFTSAVPPTTQ